MWNQSIWNEGIWNEAGEAPFIPVIVETHDAGVSFILDDALVLSFAVSDELGGFDEVISDECLR